MPNLLVDTVRFHHEPDQAEVDPVLASTTHLAETVCAARLAGDDLDPLTYEVERAALELTGLDRSDFEAVDLELKAEIDRARELFG